MVFKINDFLSLFKIFIFTLLIWITYFSNQSYILISSRSKNGQLITPFALKVTRVLSELSQSSSQSSVLNNQQVDIIQDKSDIPKENGKIKLFNSSSNSSKSPQNIKDPYNTKQKFKAVKYGISIKKLIRKLEGFLHVDYVVNELKEIAALKN
ncbi:Plasmodium exported protein, unknown function [Plasmodium berghei ANKA]|uniref:Uncharacterized protein n=1 Tax=Plasmodium berghei (strain Anka) TaxID=5823 RepID=A0A509ABV5_PLABA|nr:Plasmodium exported protein, unknown function [Plasmodium berghei ANKA]VUC54035.1 Plasmodium exported protein, unknown function [Plasmodium berghei ANKA]|eukprot:XP_034419883.1 Plasmodium exported protein, unknown function [Plasmodium berghei ANKA]